MEQNFEGYLEWNTYGFRYADWGSLKSRCNRLFQVVTDPTSAERWCFNRFQKSLPRFHYPFMWMIFLSRTVSRIYGTTFPQFWSSEYSSFRNIRNFIIWRKCCMLKWFFVNLEFQLFSKNCFDLVGLKFKNPINDFNRFKQYSNPQDYSALYH